MIENLLSYPPVTEKSLILVSAITGILLTALIKYKKIEFDKAMAISGIFLTVVLGAQLYLSHKVQRTYVSDYAWKQIYTNDKNADVTLTQIGFLYKSKDIDAGKPLDYNKDWFDDPGNLQEQPLFEITVKNDNETVTKTAKLTQVISDSEITKNSKIVKVEYRPVKGYYQKLWSFTGNLIEAPKDSAEIRVTIQNESQSELNDLFEPTKEQ